MKAFLFLAALLVGAYALQHTPARGGGRPKPASYHPRHDKHDKHDKHYRNPGRGGGRHDKHDKHDKHYRNPGRGGGQPLQPVYDHARSNSCGSCAKPYCPANQVAVQVPPKQPYCCSPWECQPRGGGSCVIDGVVVPDDGQQHNVNCKSICKCVSGNPQCVSACPPAVISCDIGHHVVTDPPVPPACCPTQHCEPDVCYYRGFLLTTTPHRYGCEEECTCDGEAISCNPIPCGDPPVCDEGDRLVTIPPGPGECCTTWHCEPDPLVCRLPGGVILQDGAQNVQVGCQICSCASGRPLCLEFSCPIVEPPQCPYSQHPITHPPVPPACCPTVTCG